MATEYVVDTHAIVWFLEGNPRLGEKARAILENADSKLIIPLIVLAEACWIIERGRTSIPNAVDFLAAVDDDPRVNVIPLDRSILDRTLSMDEIEEMHDRQIVATALLLMDEGRDIAVITKDANIRHSGLVSTAW
jgi:PIN domain nuclease of toxin-antitoxin system